MRELGIWALPRRMTPGSCRRLRAEMAAAASVETKVLKRKKGYVMDRFARRTRLAAVSPESGAQLSSFFRALRPRLERRFGVRLRGIEEPQFLVYRRGDYFTPHTDRAAYRGFGASRRRVSVVLYLSREARRPERGAYCGGELTFFGLVQGGSIGRFGFSLVGKPGLVVAFRSDVPHEVTPVVFGLRCTVVCWYY